MPLNLRHNALPLFSTLACLALLVLVVLTVDRQLYQRDKVDLIQGEYFRAFPVQDPQLRPIAYQYLLRTVEDPQRRPIGQEWLRRTSSPGRRELEQNLRERFRRNLTTSLPLVGISLRRDGKVLIEREREDDRRFNNWRNCLIPRDFRSQALIRFDDRDLPGQSLGELVTEYTSPVGFEPLERLTARYRLALILVVAGIVFVYLALVWFLVLPVRRVTRAIQTGRSGHVQFVERPRTRLDVLYNVMARDALLSDLDRALESSDGTRLGVGRDELLEALAARLREAFGFERVAFLTVRSGEASEGGHVVGEVPLPREGEPALCDRLSADLDAVLSASGPNGREDDGAGIWQGRDGDAALFAGAAESPGEPGWAHVLVVGGVAKGMTEEWTRGTLRRILGRVSGLLERHSLRSRELFRERSQANVNLARSMGHDLTNVIATARLELMTLTQLIDAPDEDGAAARESVERLRGSTRALQRIVDLYRAYENLESPRYEPVDLHGLLCETVEIFALAMSSPAEVEFDFAERLPEVRCEPRLLKLAVFNLLANARDALRDAPPAGGERPRILLQTRVCDGMDTRVEVHVRDNGPGIRNAEGGTATPDEIDRIFELGYTTKEAGEGLGLNWVRTIVVEFHEGEIHAVNAPEGGAIFTVTLGDPSGKPSSRESEQV